MSYPFIRSSVSASITASGPKTTHADILLPATILAGDKIVVVFNPGRGLAGTYTSTYTGTFLEIADLSSAQLGISAAYKDADGTEGGTNITITVPSSCYGLYSTYAIGGAGGNPEAIAVSGSSDPPSLTHSTGYPKCLSIASVGVVDTSGAYSGAPAGYSNFSAFNGGNLDFAVASANTTGTENPGAFSGTISGILDSVALTILVPGSDAGFGLFWSNF